MKFITLIPTLVFVCLLVFPEFAGAQFIPCDGSPENPCNSCDVVVLANNVIDWLIGVIMVLFALLMVYAGFELVTANGNPSALTSAKSKFINAIIGFIIVLAAWIVVDTVMIGLLGNNGQIDRGERGLLPWSEIECTTQSVTTVTPGDVGLADIGTGLGSTQTIVTECTTPEECEALAAACEGEAIVDRTDPTGPTTVTCSVTAAPQYSGNSAIVAYASARDAEQCQYSQANRLSRCETNPGYTDCSQLVDSAFQAAGCRSPGNTTAAMYPRATSIGDRSSLRAGDAIVYRFSCSTGTCGHVVLCRDDGCSTIIHARGRGARDGLPAEYPIDSQIRVEQGAEFLNRTGARVLRASDYCSN